MSTDEKKLAALEAAAGRVGISIASHHAAVFDAALLAVPGFFSAERPVMACIAINAWSAYLAYIVTHVSKVCGLSHEEVVKCVAEGLSAQEVKPRAN